MTIEQYKLRAAEFRAHMEKPMAPFDSSCVSGIRESAYLPGGEKRSMKVAAPPGDSTADYTALNGKSWKQSQKNGRRLGRPRKVKR